MTLLEQKALLLGAVTSEWSDRRTIAKVLGQRELKMVDRILLDLLVEEGKLVQQEMKPFGGGFPARKEYRLAAAPLEVLPHRMAELDRMQEQEPDAPRRSASQMLNPPRDEVTATRQVFGISNAGDDPIDDEVVEESSERELTDGERGRIQTLFPPAPESSKRKTSLFARPEPKVKPTGVIGGRSKKSED